MIWNPFSIMLLTGVITLLFICSFQWFKSGLRRDNVNEKLIFFGMAFFAFCAAFSWIFYLTSEFFISGVYKNNTFYGDYNIEGGYFNSDNSYYYFLNKIGSIINVIGFSLMVLTFEMIVKRTKYTLTVLNTSFIVIFIISPWETFQFLLNYFFLPISTLIVIIILLLYAKWSRYELKSISSLMLFGYFIIIIGTLLNNPAVRAANVIPLIISPVIFILGLLILIFPTLIDPSHFSRARIYWLLFGILIVIISWFLLFFMINVAIFAGYIILTFLISIAMATFMLYYSMRIIKSQSITKSKYEHPNILRMFTKPQKLTEEEVSVAKEKKICLVCKGKLARTTYICPDCSTFYCSKCSEALTNLENACWVCETPFDDSKPVRLPEKKEEEVVVEDVDQKKTKKK